MARLLEPDAGLSEDAAIRELVKERERRRKLQLVRLELQGHVVSEQPYTDRTHFPSHVEEEHDQVKKPSKRVFGTLSREYEAACQRRGILPKPSVKNATQQQNASVKVSPRVTSGTGKRLKDDPLYLG